MWSSWVKRKGIAQVMYIGKLTDGPKRVKKTFSLILERIFWNDMTEGEKMESHQKGFLNLKRFLLSKYWLPLLFEETLGAFLFPSFFYICSSLEDSGGLDDIWEENHFSKNFFSNGLTWNGMVMTMDIPVVDTYSGTEFCTPIWLNYDYGHGGVVDILAVDAYSRVEVCTSTFLGEASK
jgi:hypothetical protein